MRNQRDRLQQMHAAYGTFKGVTCRTCPHLQVHISDDDQQIWHHCRLYSESAGNGCSWRESWQACNGFTISPQQAYREGLFGKIRREGRR